MSEQVKVFGFEQDGGKRSETQFLVKHEILSIDVFHLIEDRVTEEGQNLPAKFILFKLVVGTVVKVLQLCIFGLQFQQRSNRGLESLGIRLLVEIP